MADVVYVVAEAIRKFLDAIVGVVRRCQIGERVGTLDGAEQIVELAAVVVIGVLISAVDVLFSTP